MSRQLLTFSGRATPHAERIDIQEWLQALSGVLRSIPSEQTTLRLDVPPAPLWVEADRNQLEQVLTNLVTNAHEAMPHGGSLEISVTRVALPARNPTRLPAGSYVKFRVSDSGTGVPVHLRSQLFSPFISTKPRGRGLGLGLATAMMIVRRLGGELIHQPSTSGGAAFSVFLPLVGSSPDNARPQPSPLPRGGGERILIAEDDPAIRTVATALLETLGYVADVAGTGEEALARCEGNEGSPYDVLLSDISMPGMNGYDLAERVRRAQPGIALILMSGYAGDPTVMEASRRLGALFLEKPFTRDSLSQRLAEALNSGREAKLARPTRGNVCTNEADCHSACRAEPNAQRRRLGTLTVAMPAARAAASPGSASSNTRQCSGRTRIRSAASRNISGSGFPRPGATSRGVITIGNKERKPAASSAGMATSGNPPVAMATGCRAAARRASAATGSITATAESRSK